MQPLLSIRRVSLVAIVLSLQLSCGGAGVQSSPSTGGSPGGVTSGTSAGPGTAGLGSTSTSAGGSGAGGSAGGTTSGPGGSGSGASGSAANSTGGSAAVSGAAAGTSAAGASAAGTSAAGANAGASGSDSAIPASFDTVKLVLGGGGGVMPCSAAPCHGVNGMAPPDHPLELPPNDDQKLYANLTSYVSKACNGTKLVDPGKPMSSALVTILKGPCGATPRMPYGCSPDAGDCIPDEYIAAVAQWIANGAPRP